MTPSRELIQDPPGKRPADGPESVYANARKGWDDRLGSRVVQAKNWRLAFVCAMGFAGVSLSGWIYQTMRPPLPPLIVAVDKSTGIAQVLGRADNINYVPQVAEIKNAIGKLLLFTRSVSSDPVVVKQNWLMAYKFTRPAAATKLNEWARGSEGSLTHMAMGETVSLEIISATPIAGSESYAVRWSETVYTSEGGIKERYIMSGNFRVEIDPPRDEKNVFINPVGIFVKDYSWSKEANISPPNKAPTTPGNPANAPQGIAPTS